MKRVTGPGLVIALVAACGGASKPGAPGNVAGSGGQAPAAAGSSSQSAGRGGGANGGDQHATGAGGAAPVAGTPSQAGSAIEGGSAGEGAGGVPEGGSPAQCEAMEVDELCRLDRLLALGPLVVVDEDEDGKVEPGETIVIQSALINPSDEGHYQYPGVEFVVSEPAVEPAQGGWHNLFGIAPNQSQAFELSFEIPDSLSVGSELTFRVWPRGPSPKPDAECCGLHERTVTLSVE